MKLTEAEKERVRRVDNDNAQNGIQIHQWDDKKYGFTFYSDAFDLPNMEYNK